MKVSQENLKIRAVNLSGFVKKKKKKTLVEKYKWEKL